MPPRRAQLDPGLQATIVSRRPLLYREGADVATDRPAHLRAGSSLCWFGDRLAVVQDDANFIALVDPLTGLADAVTLPVGEGGVRLFDDGRGNKKFKLDLEACCAIPGDSGPRLLAFGSGSKKRRRNVAVVQRSGDDEPSVSLIDAASLYLRLEDAVDFAGSDMNVEGALAMRDAVRLFGRGNGAARGGRLPLNATCDLPIRPLLEYLAAPSVNAVPSPTIVVAYDLGHLGGLPLGFTDATAWGAAVLYTATGEASSDASEDGLVSGSVLGIIPEDGDPKYALLCGSDGEMAREKVEGVVAVPGTRDRVYVVLDLDDATRASDLCEVRLEGEWG